MKKKITTLQRYHRQLIECQIRNCERILTPSLRFDKFEIISQSILLTNHFLNCVIRTYVLIVLILCHLFSILKFRKYPVKMNFESEDFQFALEMIIVSRNENGATLTDIRGLLDLLLLSLCSLDIKWRRRNSFEHKAY